MTGIYIEVCTDDGYGLHNEALVIASNTRMTAPRSNVISAVNSKAIITYLLNVFKLFINFLCYRFMVFLEIWYVHWTETHIFNTAIF